MHEIIIYFIDFDVVYKKRKRKKKEVCHGSKRGKEEKK